jgi:mono/diheme cytochrome c family protein
MAQSGKELFDKECSGCHTIGGGDSGGPDLKDVTANRPASWLERVIVEPEKLTAEKDPVHLALVKKYGEMPNVGVAREDARKIIAYLHEESKGAASTGQAPASGAGAAPAAIAATPERIARGRGLFTGAMPFANGGAPCASCHGFAVSGVAGGTLASDLGTRIEAAGEPRLRTMLGSLKFPVMREIYADRPLTGEEIEALAVFAGDAVARKSSPSSTHFPAAGVGVFAVLIAGLTLYKRRVRR